MPKPTPAQHVALTIHRSARPRRTRKILLAALTLAATAVIASTGILVAPASARPRTTYIVRDGFYGGLAGPDTAIFFWVEHRRVYHLRVDTVFACHNTSTGEDYERAFQAGPLMPQGEEIPRSGELTIQWAETYNTRYGHITIVLDLRGPRVARVSVDAPPLGEGLEDCTGSKPFPLKRSTHVIPRPAGP
jgi:hypothetical protein